MGQKKGLEEVSGNKCTMNLHTGEVLLTSNCDNLGHVEDRRTRAKTGDNTSFQCVNFTYSLEDRGEVHTSDIYHRSLEHESFHTKQH